MRRGGGITARGTHLKFINMVVHDTAGGFGVWAESTGTEVSGNIVYYNGWFAPDRGHGHGIYTQNAGGDLRTIRDNIVFDNFSHGIHAYGSDRAFLDDIVLQGNISFNNGSLSGDFARDILLGGGRIAQNPVLRSNSTYGSAQTNLGYAAGCANGVVEDNYFVGKALILANCTPAMRRNVIISAVPTPAENQQPGNAYHDRKPAGVVVRVLPSAYEPGRSHVVVYNWDHQDRVRVDMGAACGSPQAIYRVQDAQNFFGPAVHSGRCGNGTIELPMTGLTAAPPVGDVPALPRHNAPEFAVFVVISGPGSPAATN
jgi:hypothetical protein